MRVGHRQSRHADALSPSHTGSYDLWIVRLVAIWPMFDRSVMFAIRPPVAIAYCDRSFVGGIGSMSSYAWSGDHQRLEMIDGTINRR